VPRVAETAAIVAAGVWYALRPASESPALSTPIAARHADSRKHLADAHSLIVYNGELIVGGRFDTAINGEVTADGAVRETGRVLTDHVARWDGHSWGAFGNTEATLGPFVVQESTLFAAGLFVDQLSDLLQGAPCVARWDMAGWEPLGGEHFRGFPPLVAALAVYKDELIAAGAFWLPGETAAADVVAWNGSDWQPLGTGADAIVYSLAVYNDRLVAGGNFETLDGRTMHGIAQWNGSP